MKKKDSIWNFTSIVKKGLWVYAGLYGVGVIYVFINSLINPANSIGSDPLTYIFLLSFFLPPAVIVLRLLDKKVPIIWTLFSLFIIALPILAILNFNTMSLETIGKVCLFLPMIAALVYYLFKRQK